MSAAVSVAVWMDVGIHPNDLAKLLNAMFADVIESA